MARAREIRRYEKAPPFLGDHELGWLMNRKKSLEAQVEAVEERIKERRRIVLSERAEKRRRASADFMKKVQRIMGNT